MVYTIVVVITFHKYEQIEKLKLECTCTVRTMYRLTSGERARATGVVRGGEKSENTRKQKIDFPEDSGTR